MSKLINHFTESEKEGLTSLLNDSSDMYDLPSYEDVIEYLENTDDDEMSEEVMGDLIIQYLEDEGIMFDLC